MNPSGTGEDCRGSLARANIEYLFQQVAQFAFEEEYASKHDYVVTTDTFLRMMPTIRPSLTEGMIEDFKKDSIAYARA